MRYKGASATKEERVQRSKERAGECEAGVESSVAKPRS